MQPDWVLDMNRLGASRTPFLFVLDFELLEPVVISLADISPECIRYEMDGLKEAMLRPSATHPRATAQQPAKAKEDFLGNKILVNKSPISFEDYQIGFERVLKAIQRGDSYLLNLTYPTPIKGIESLEKVFDSVSAPFKLLFQNRFVVFSPERFVSMSDGCIRTFPMKGTIDASLPNSEAILLEDVKEQEEHATVVDLLRNDLSIVAKKVTVERYRFISKIVTAGKTLLQCSSEISGQLKEGYLDELGDIFYNLLPAGSVTGAPKKKTVELIKSIEPVLRGYYTGVFGVFDGKQLDSAVMIRMIEQKGNEFIYRSGGGITYRSDARQEYQEMIDKVYLPIA